MVLIFFMNAAIVKLRCLHLSFRCSSMILAHTPCNSGCFFMLCLCSQSNVSNLSLSTPECTKNSRNNLRKTSSLMPCLLNSRLSCVARFSKNTGPYCNLYFSTKRNIWGWMFCLTRFRFACRCWIG